MSASSELTERTPTAGLVGSQARYDAILNALSDWMFLLTSEGVFLDFHAQDRSDLVAPPEQFLGKSVRDVFPPGLAGAFTACFTEAMDTGGPCTLEYSLPLRDGVRHYEARVVRCDRDKLLSIVRDVTEGKRADAEAHGLRAELAHAGRVSVLGALAGSLAHEIDEPLTAIMGNAKAALHLIADPQPDLAPLREMLHDIVADSRRAGDVLQRVRTFIRKRPAVLAPVDVNGTIQEVVGLLNSDLLRRRIWLETHLSPERLFVLGDGVQLQQVVVNLLMNAFDAVRPREIGGRRVILRTDRNNAQVVVSVVDYGEGVPDEALAHIFEPFFTTKSDGLGLGLQICQAIVSSHGGTLQAERNADRGMTFSFRIPVSSTREPEA